MKWMDRIFLTSIQFLSSKIKMFPFSIWWYRNDGFFVFNNLVRVKNTSYLWRSKLNKITYTSTAWEGCLFLWTWDSKEPRNYVVWDKNQNRFELQILVFFFNKKLVKEIQIMKKAHVTNCPHVSYVALTRMDKHKTSIENEHEEEN